MVSPRYRGKLRSGPGREPGPFSAAIDHLDRLVHGLSPAALADGRPIREAIADVAALAWVPVDCTLDENLDLLPADTAALIYYATSECMTNIARHTHATAARIEVRLTGHSYWTSATTAAAVLRRGRAAASRGLPIAWPSSAERF